MPWVETQTYDSDSEGVSLKAMDVDSEAIAWRLMDHPEYQKNYYPDVKLDSKGVDDAVMRAFQVYDFDCSGAIDDANELLQMTTSLCMVLKCFKWQKEERPSGNFGYTMEVRPKFSVSITAALTRLRDGGF